MVLYLYLIFKSIFICFYMYIFYLTTLNFFNFVYNNKRLRRVSWSSNNWNGEVCVCVVERDRERWNPMSFFLLAYFFFNFWVVFVLHCRLCLCSANDFKIMRFEWAVATFSNVQILRASSEKRKSTAAQLGWSKEANLDVSHVLVCFFDLFWINLTP